MSQMISRGSGDGELGDEVAFAEGRGPLDDPVGHFLDGVLDAGDPAGVEGGRDDAAETGVARVVGGDHAGEVLDHLRRQVGDADRTLSRAVDLRMPADLDHVGVAGDGPVPGSGGRGQWRQLGGVRLFEEGQGRWRRRRAKAPSRSVHGRSQKARSERSMSSTVAHASGITRPPYRACPPGARPVVGRRSAVALTMTVPDPKAPGPTRRAHASSTAPGRDQGSQLVLDERRPVDRSRPATRPECLSRHSSRRRARVASSAGRSSAIRLRSHRARAGLAPPVDTADGDSPLGGGRRAG